MKINKSELLKIHQEVIQKYKHIEKGSLLMELESNADSYPATPIVFNSFSTTNFQNETMMFLLISVFLFNYVNFLSNY